MVWSLNQRWIQSTFNDQLLASSRWNANMISSFFGSRKFGSIVLDFGVYRNVCAPSSLSSTMPLPFRSPFHWYLTGILSVVVLMMFGLMAWNSLMYITS